MSMDYEDAIELADEILAMCEDLPERAEDFRDSIETKVKDMREWIEENQYVTERMATALENMHGGVTAWL